MDTMLDTKEASAFLGIGEEKLNELVSGKVCPAYLIAGKFLRFKKSELEAIRDLLEERIGPGEERIFDKAFGEVKGAERFREILRANDVYFIIGVIVFLILAFIFLKFRI